jgi:phage head maturation protease
VTKLYALAEVKSVDDDSPHGSFEVILSTSAMDRDGEVIDEKAFEPLPDHMTFDYDHGMSVATTIGSGVPRYEDGVLKVKGTYSSRPIAQEVRTLVREGHIRSTSVAFMDAQREQKDGTPHITKAELLNGAFVAIPSNRQAAVLSAKGYAERVASAPGQAVPVLERGPLRKGHGMTARDLRTSLDSAVTAAHGGRDRYVWVRDYTDEWVVFSVMVENDLRESDRGIYQQNYTVTNGVAALTDDPIEVVERTVYAPKNPDSAPVAAARSAAKSPVSVVAQARLAVARARLLLT